MLSETKLMRYRESDKTGVVTDITSRENFISLVECPAMCWITVNCSRLIAHYPISLRCLIDDLVNVCHYCLLIAERWSDFYCNANKSGTSPLNAIINPKSNFPLRFRGPKLNFVSANGILINLLQPPILIISNESYRTSTIRKLRRLYSFPIRSEHIESVFAFMRLHFTTPITSSTENFSP